MSEYALPAGQGTGSGAFGFAGGKWRYNLQTSNYSAPGIYKISMTTGNPDEYVISDPCVANFVIE